MNTYMILIHISCNTLTQALEIGDFLLNEKLLYNAMISEKLLNKHLQHGQKKGVEQTLVIGTTKALLFNEIKDAVRVHFSDDVPLIYAMPIIYMDEDQTEKLQTETQKV